MATPGKADGLATMWVQLIEAFNGPRPTDLGYADLWIALINAVENFTGGGGGGVPSDTVTGPDTFGASPDPGVSLLYSRGDHDHGLPVLTPATSSTGPAGFGTSPVTGTSAHYARQDHSHGNPTFPGTAQLAPVDVVMGALPTGGVLSGLPVIDGVQLTDGMRVLCPHLSALYGASAVSGGIWVAHAGAWTRPTDFTTGSTFTQAFVMSLGGTYRNNTLWSCTSETALTIDTDPQLWTNVNHSDPAHQFMEDYLEVVDFDNPWTDPPFAWGQCISFLPETTDYKSNGTAITQRFGTIEWPHTPDPLVCGWAAATSSHGNPNAWAKLGVFPAPLGSTALIQNVGQGVDQTKLVSCGPMTFAGNIGAGGYTGDTPKLVASCGKWDHMTLDGTLSLCGTGYFINAMQEMRVTDLAIRNFGPCAAPVVTSTSVPGSTLQQGGFEVIITVAGSQSTPDWAGSDWQGWTDVAAGGFIDYTLSPSEGQPCAGQQVIIGPAAGISIAFPAYITPQPPWGYNVYLRPVMQFATSSNGTTPTVGSFTTGSTYTVQGTTPPLGLPATNGTFYVAATTPSGQGGLAKMTYDTLSGNTFSNVIWHQAGSTVGTGALLAVGNVCFNAAQQFNRIAANIAPGPAPAGTPLVWSLPWRNITFPTPLENPLSLGWLGTGLYITGGQNAPAQAQAFPERNQLNIRVEGCGQAFILDGSKLPGQGSTSFEYNEYLVKMDVPPDMGGMLAINGANCENQWWRTGRKWSTSNDAGGWWGAIMGTGSGANIITYMTTQLITTPFGGMVVPGGGIMYALVLGATITDSEWSENLESDAGNVAQLGYNAQWLQTATCLPTHFIIDVGASYPAASPGIGSYFTNNRGGMGMIDHGFFLPAAPLPAGGLGSINIGGVSTQTGGGSLSWTPRGGTNGGISFTGSIKGDSKFITLFGATYTQGTPVFVHV